MSTGREEQEAAKKKKSLDVGLAPDYIRFPGVGFVKYMNHRRGTLSIIKPLELTEKSVTLGEVVSELEVISRHDELPEGDEHESEIEDEEEEESEEEADEIEEIEEQEGAEA